jgi:hypothetical protein
MAPELQHALECLKRSDLDIFPALEILNCHCQQHWQLNQGGMRAIPEVPDFQLPVQFKLFFAIGLLH